MISPAGSVDPLPPDRDPVGAPASVRSLLEPPPLLRTAEEAARQSELRYQLLVQSVRDYAIFMLDTEGRVTTWNSGARRIKQYEADEIIGQHFSVFYPPETKDLPPMELREAARVGRFEDEGWRVRKDGSRFWANVIITALRDDSGTLVGYAKVTRDLTERKEAEDRAVADARRLAAAEAGNRAKSEFLATLSHELRTPLNAIGGYAELIEAGVGGPVTPQQAEYASRIRNSQQHLLNLINNLLNYSRIEAGQMLYEIRPVTLDTVVRRALAMVDPQAAAKGLAVHHESAVSEVRALADEAKVEQIVLNLLSNAVKFTSAGEIVARCRREGDQALISISDTGPGIPPEHQAAIFEPFVQLGRSLKTAVEGTGLGLAISRDLARGMGGELTVESRAGSGSTFTLRLPIAE